MNQIELLEHILGNLKAGKSIADGLLHLGTKARCNILRSVDWNFPEYYTLAPRTHKVKGFDVPGSEIKEPDMGMVYYTAAPTSRDFTGTALWSGSDYCLLMLARGLIHLTTEAAIANGKAICGIDPEAETEE